MYYLDRLPLFILLIGVSGAAMLVPSAYAAATGLVEIAQIFLLSAALLLVLAVLLGLATWDSHVGEQGRSVLATMLGAYGVLPVAMAMPLAMALPDTGLYNAWWEMVSCVTTTGATLYAADMLAPPLHLWRALVGWLGGLFILVAAVAVLAPLKVGGFEILASSYGRNEKFAPLPESAVGRRRPASQMLNLARQRSTPTSDALKVAGQVAPWYAGLTLALWVLLLLAGDPGLVALSRALGTLSTSGISPVSGAVGLHSGLSGEAVVFAFMALALSRRFWPGGEELRASERRRDDPELRLGLGVVVLVAAVLFVRHFFATIELTTARTDLPTGALISLKNAAVATWGGLFNAMSFLTTTGWNSIDWSGARSWSGLQSPGLLLAGLAIMGGGVATTAGGVKLLRVYALARQSQRELDRIVHPASVSGGGHIERRLRGEGAYLAFIFFMLFALSIAVVVLLVSIHQIEFDTAVILSVSALTNTGPLAGTITLMPSFEASAGVASNPWQGWSGLALLPKTVLAGAMIVGRLETLAILALLTPDFWRR